DRVRRVARRRRRAPLRRRVRTPRLARRLGTCRGPRLARPHRRRWRLLAVAPRFGWPADAFLGLVRGVARREPLGRAVRVRAAPVTVLQRFAIWAVAGAFTRFAVAPRAFASDR